MPKDYPSLCNGALSEKMRDKADAQTVLSHLQGENVMTGANEGGALKHLLPLYEICKSNPVFADLAMVEIGRNQRTSGFAFCG
jgi:hypothetical protein